MFERALCGRLALLAAALVVPACASIPKGQYGVLKVDWTGVDAVNPDAIEACLVTRERDRSELSLGLGSGKCGEPPFDSTPPTIPLWTLPWTDWPVWDPAIFEVDKRRIERWYRARGFYDARVLGTRTYADGRMVPDATDCEDPNSGCRIEVAVQMQEGKPVHVADVEVESKLTLPPDVLERVTTALTVQRGLRFDEYDYEQDKQLVQQLLWNASYGEVTIDRDQRTARVVYKLDPGPSCRFGSVKVQGADEVPELLIIQAANIPDGKPYSYEQVLDAEQAIFKLGAFSSVQLKPQGEGELVDLIAVVRVGRLVRWSGGIGIMSGTLQRPYSAETTSIAQWDVHLSGAWEHRNFFGGLRRLRIEERPRLIQLAEFPKTTSPRPGNLLSVRFEQPATFERRTTLFVENTWDVGPDPFEGFFRNDLGSKVGLERAFWRQRISARAAIAHDFYEIFDSEQPDNVSSYRLPFLEQIVSLDLRNHPQRPKRGVYLSVATQEAFELGGYGSWNYFRIIPDVRGYVPLMWDFVLAARFTLGAMFITDSAPGLDPSSELLGPQTYRLRGGGANGNRGFQAGQLGAGRNGGLRRYEASIELRVPIGPDFGMVLFGDVGDVHAGTAFRFEHLNTAVGFGLRYFTILGAIRFDAGWRVEDLQVLGGGQTEKRVKPGALPDAAHLTIGEAF
jgi:translocation and assembly module TamA